MSIFAYGNRARCEQDYNEDACRIERIGDYLVMIVADGNGSPPGNLDAGSLCASLALDWLNHGMLNPDGTPKSISITELQDILSSTLFGLSRSILAINAIDDRYSAMYVSMTIAIIKELSLEMVCGSVGNCEIHLLRNGEDKILNDVHSEAYQSYKRGELTEVTWREDPKRGLLTSALGKVDEPAFDVFMERLQADDILFMTSDGLFHVTGPQGILETLFENSEDITKAVDGVLDKAAENQCPDNCVLITALVQDDVKGRESERPKTYQRSPQQSQNRGGTGLSSARMDSEERYQQRPPRQVHQPSGNRQSGQQLRRGAKPRR